MSHSNEIDKPMLDLLERMFQEGDIKRIFELGTGWGIWGNVLRVQLGYKGTLEGWDLHKPYAEALAKLNAYDKIHNEDALNFWRRGEADLVMVPDILEHLDKGPQAKLLNLLDIYPRVIITTPLIPPPNRNKVKKRSPFYGNPLNLHISNVSQEELERRGYHVKLISLRYFPRWLKPWIWIREKMRGVALAEYEILAWKG